MLSPRINYYKPGSYQSLSLFCSTLVDPDAALSVALVPSNSTLNEGDRFTLTCMANRSLYLQNSPTINFYDNMGNRIVTSDGISVGLTVESGSGTVLRTLTFDSLDRSYSMEYRCTATVTFLPPPHTISREAIWDLVVKSELMREIIKEPQTPRKGYCMLDHFSKDIALGPTL